MGHTEDSLQRGALLARLWALEQSLTATSQPPDPATPGLRRVFVIDGSEQDADELAARLRAHYPGLDEVRWTGEPQAVIDRIEAFKPDVVITDHCLPGHDLISTISALRRRWPHLPVLVLSAVAGEEAAVLALKAGASNFLPKSRSERLLQVIDLELAQARLQDANAQLLTQADRQRSVNEAIFDQVDAALWILSPAGGVERGNRHGIAMLGGFDRLRLEGFAGLQAHWADSGEAILPDGWPGARAVAHGETIAPRLMHVHAFDGRLRAWRCGAAPLTAEDGSGLGAVVTAIDVTDEIALQERLRSAEDRLRRLSRNQFVRHEKQLAALSRELHDNLGQVLSLLKLHLMSAVRPNQAPQRRRLELEEALPLIDLSLERLREMCGELRPSELSDFGLPTALASLAAAAQRASGLSVSSSESGQEQLLEATHQLGLFRVAQQALTNALRHADASAVRLVLHWREDAAELSVIDDGHGFEVDAMRPASHQGLHGMRERMELLGGQLRIDSTPRGTTVSASVPTAAALKAMP